MKSLLLYILLLFPFALRAQTEEDKLVRTMKDLHTALVQKNTVSLNQHTDRALSYGHSNGWVESKNDMMKNLETGYIGYQSYKTDSVKAVVSGTLGQVRYNADIQASLKGKAETYRLKVLEVWVKKGNRWLLFARQSVAR